MLPMMDPPDVAALEEAFLRRRGRAVDVLEWGSGGSTVHFPRFLREQGIAFTWNSVEHDDDWFRKVSGVVRGEDAVRVHHLPLRDLRPHGAAPESDRYVDFPEGIGRKFDVILVDGRFRRRCLLAAARWLREDGEVFLHDAHRKYYHCAFRAWPQGRFLHRKMWRGRHIPPDPLRRAGDFLNIFYYRFLYKAHKALRGGRTP
jgi:hypothetical protein